MKEAPKDITFLYCLLERDQGRLLHFERNLKILPSIEKFSAVNGYDPVETLAEMMDNDIVFNAKDLKFQKSWVNKNGVKIVEDEKDAGTFGTLANWITKFKCLKYQIENQLPYICIMEDDLILKDSFFEVISDCVKDLKSNPKKTHSRIAAWGECFVFSLDGAKKTLDMLLEVGFQYPIGRQLSNEPPFSKNCMRKKHSEIRKGIIEKPYELAVEKHKGNCVDRTLKFKHLDLNTHADFKELHLNFLNEPDKALDLTRITRLIKDKEEQFGELMGFLHNPFEKEWEVSLASESRRRTVYVYRNGANGGGAGKVLTDLIRFLHAEEKYEIVLVSFLITDYDSFYTENGMPICLTHISIPALDWWRAKAADSLRKHVMSRDNPILISLLDSNSNTFFTIASSFLANKNLKWINFDTNHPSIIKRWFRSKNSATGINYNTMSDALDYIRIENPNFGKYINKKNQNKICSFYNTVTIPEFDVIDFSEKFNLISVNGLRERRKSIVPFVENFDVLIDRLEDFKLYVIGTICHHTKAKLDKVLKSNPSYADHIEVMDPVSHLHDYYASCDMHITTATYEGTSNAILESFCHDLPVAGLSSSFGINETIEDGINGILCNSPREMAEKVCDVLKDKKQKKKLKDGCKKIKPLITNSSEGIERYRDIIENSTLNHSNAARKIITEYSQEYLSNPWIYRRALDAIVVYCDASNLNFQSIGEIIKSDAYAEASTCYFIVKNDTGEDVGDKLTHKFKKNKILLEFSESSYSAERYVKYGNPSDCFALLFCDETIKHTFNDEFIDTVLFIDSSNDPAWSLENYYIHLRNMAQWQKKDNWIWFLGAHNKFPNNCVLSYEPIINSSFPTIMGGLKNRIPNLFEESLMVGHCNLPKEIMGTVRRI